VARAGTERGWLRRLLPGLMVMLAVTAGMPRARGTARGEVALVPPTGAASRSPAAEPEQQATAVVAQAEAALGLSAEKLDAPFGGAPPAWARQWVERRGRDDLFDRRWRGHAVRLPAPYGDTEWLGVFSMYHPVETDADHFHRLERRDGRWVLGPEIDEREPAAQYRIVHHQLDVRLLPAENRMEATDRMTVRRLAGARGLLLARMNDDYGVQAVRVAGVAARFVRAGGLLAIVLPTGTPAELPVEVKYGGTVHHPGMDSVDPEVSYLFSYWYPNVARLPATGDLTVTAPAAWTVIGQGELQSRTVAEEEARTRWRQDHPVCWLQFAAGPYQRTSRQVADKTLNVYLLGPNSEKAEAAFRSLEKALPFFSRRLGAFPWTHYDVVEYPMLLGALESYSFTGISLELVPTALPHELAHSWWGGLVPNTYTTDMWNEAFATYSERLLAEATHPRSQPGTRPGEERRRGQRLRSRVPIEGAVDALEPDHSMAGYQKGAAVQHMFRRTVGDRQFYRTLARFTRDMAGQAATWRDFQRAAEAVAGHSQGEFFDPWLTRGDVPRLRWGAARQTHGVLEAVIEMSNPAYRLRLPIAIDTEDGKRHLDVVELSGLSTRFQRSFRSRAVRLVLDPAADFLLEPAEERSPAPRAPDPWTLELPASAARVAPTGTVVSRGTPATSGP
jgi:hypothetical protein